MRKILFISYFYPPCNLTASNRVFYWAHLFAKNNFDTTVLTRHWPTQIETFDDLYLSEKFGEIQTHEDNVKVVCVDEYNSFFKKMKQRRSIKFFGLSKLISFIDLFFSYRFLFFSQYKFFKKKAAEIIAREPNNWIVIISAGPHQMFHVGYLLKKQFPELIWIADYRDEWSSRPIFEKKFNYLNILNRKFEKRWLSNIEFFTYVNDQYVERIEQFINKEGHVIENGYNDPIQFENLEEDLSTLSFTFLGTLYNHQEISSTSNLLHSFQKQHPKLSVKLNFVGISLQDGQVERVRHLFKWCQELRITARLNTTELKPIIARTDIFLMFPIQNMKGVIPTKVYDYLPYRKPIMFYPNDAGKIGEILNSSNLGIIGTDQREVFLQLEQFVLNKKKLPNSFTNIENYSREFFSLKLIRLISKKENPYNEGEDILPVPSHEKVKPNKNIQTSSAPNVGLKKVLVISYFAPPANFVASERISSWMKYLPKFGIHPVLLTRYWADEQTSTENIDVVMRSQQIISPTSQTHKIAIKKTLLEKLGLTNFKYVRKINSILVYTKLYVFPSVSHSKEFLQAAKRLIKDQNIDKVVISGTPFYTFWIGYKLKQWNSNIEWYPDYRDTWNSIRNKEKYGIIKEFFLRKMELNKEKKWTSNANMFFTVSEDWKNSISSLIGKKGLVIKNGFDKTLNEIIATKIPRKEKTLVITYAGTIYPSQDIFSLLDAVSELVSSEQINIKVNLIGTEAVFSMEQRVLSNYENIKHAINFSPRTSKRELEIIYQGSDILWLTSFSNIPGWYPVKLFDYASTGVPILLFPTDNGVMQDFILRTRTGFTFSDKEALKIWIKNIYENPQSIQLDINYDELGKFHRSTHTEELAKFLLSES